MKNFYSKKYGLQPGDRIVEPLFQTGVLKHHAIFLGADKNGVEYVAENHKVKGVHVITAAEYFATVKKIDRIERFTGSTGERKLVVQRALQQAGRPYDLIIYNCEHFVNEAWTGRAFSSQVNNTLYILGAFILFQLITD